MGPDEAGTWPSWDQLTKRRPVIRIRAGASTLYCLYEYEYCTRTSTCRLLCVSMSPSTSTWLLSEYESESEFIQWVITNVVTQISIVTSSFHSRPFCSLVFSLTTNLFAPGLCWGLACCQWHVPQGVLHGVVVEYLSRHHRNRIPRPLPLSRLCCRAYGRQTHHHSSARASR